MIISVYLMYAKALLSTDKRALHYRQNMSTHGNTVGI